MGSLFSGKLICAHCGKKYKKRYDGKNRIPVYICQSYDNYGKCKRIPIHEQVIIDAINKRYLIRWGRSISEQDVGEKLQQMWIEDRMLFRIKVEDFEDEIIYGRNHICF